MEGLEHVHPLAMCGRVMTIFFASFVYIFLVAKYIGPERKALWFRKRKKYTFFNRRGIIGEDFNFGYPVTWQGCLAFLAIYGVIFGAGYLYIFAYPY